MFFCICFGLSLSIADYQCCPAHAKQMNEKEVQQFLVKLGVTKRLRLRFESGMAAAAPSAKPAAAAARDEEVMLRAKAHPMVQRFQETFKDSQIRQVRDLKE